LGGLLPATLAFFTPRSSGSANANEIAGLYKVELVIALIIFFAVEGALVYALIRFRRRKGAVPAQIRGNTRLEVSWTVAAALILVGLATFTFVRLSAIENPPNSGPGGATLAQSPEGTLEIASSTRKLPPNGKALNITVIGRQYIWQYVYPGASEPDGLGAPYSYVEMVVPTKTTVSLDIVSADVVHSWWIPELGGKFQAVPGYHNYTWFKIEKPGVFHGQCAFLCGRGHARMIATVTAEEPAQFEEWLSHQKQAIHEANEAARKTREKLSSQTGAAAVEAAASETP
jgi:cytochrome c oxidase subunit II